MSYLQVGGDHDRLRHVRGGENNDPREAIVGRGAYMHARMHVRYVQEVVVG